MNIVVVESPAKAKTINKYLGPGYEVLASFGHVRDLPAKNGSVDPNDNFHMIWEVDAKAGKRLADIANAVKGADKLILATDPDREGEAISWHVLEVLKQKHALKDQTIERVVFNAITKQAVADAMLHPRAIDGALVDAYLARRALDYLVGFTLSPVLWRKLPGARSAGRVQSVALRLVADRELEIEKFVAREYWSLVATLATPRHETFEARLVGADGKKIQRLDIGWGDEAQAFRRDLETARFSVAAVEAKPGKRNPPPPFTTSTMQQEASRKLGFAPAHTMRVAQRLYEGIDIGGETVGLITYMRTDGVFMAPEAISAICTNIASQYGKQYVPDAPRNYQNKQKSAQEAHEAVRPTDVARRPRDVAKYLDSDQARLYELVWLRAMASQMESAELERTTVDILARVGARTLDLRATGTVIKFDGFLTLYQEGQDDEQDDDEGKRLPAMSAGEALVRREIAASQHFTEPPPRFSEASLVKRMEELGIGRPSTYASILQVLKARAAMLAPILFPPNKDGTDPRLCPTCQNGRLSLKLGKFGAFIGCSNYPECRFTRQLDANGAASADKVLGKDPETGLDVAIKTGRFGTYLQLGEASKDKEEKPKRAGIPKGWSVEEITLESALKLLSLPREVGKSPEDGEAIMAGIGRFGPYVQHGKTYANLEAVDEVFTVGLNRAVTLVAEKRANPGKGRRFGGDPGRSVGDHPQRGGAILVKKGRYGPYVANNGIN